MGPIQSSLNQLTLAGFGAIAGVAHGVKGVLKEPKASKAKKAKAEQQKAETTSGMGNIVKIGKDYSKTNFKSYEAAVKSIYSANDAIQQKANSQFSVENRLEQIKSNIKAKVIDNINRSAKEEFGTTNDFSKSIYMLPNGESADYLKEIKNEAQISDFIRKNFKGGSK